MYAQVEKAKENKSRAVANSVAQEKRKGEQSFGFVDNRSEAIIQRKLKKRIDNSKGVTQLLRADARRYIRENHLDKDRLEDVQEYVWNTNNPEIYRAGLLEAWNKNQKGRFVISENRPSLPEITPELLVAFAAVHGINILDEFEDSSSSESHFEEKGVSSSSSKFSRTGHALSAHATSADASVRRALSKGNTYNGRWKDDSARDVLIDLFYKYLRNQGLQKGEYFVRCTIPLSVGCADDQLGKEHQCDGFFIKMSSMGSSMKKWKFSTCYPTMESEVKGNVTQVSL